MFNRYESLNRFVSKEDALASRARFFRRHGNELNMVDAEIDQKWAKLHDDSKAPNSYYDYYFTAEDIQVYLTELADDPEFGSLPIQNLGFNVEQEKAPVYGFWSYTYDGVMRGVRLISGQFTLATRYPGYMRDLLTASAKKRVDKYNNLSDNYPLPSSWKKDNENLDRYWGKTIDPSATSQGGTEWSVHPPFSLVVVYGVQGASVELDNIEGRYGIYGGDNALMADQNQRLVEGFNPSESSRIILDGCELQSVNRSYAPGMVINETYQFFARDIFLPNHTRGSKISLHGSGGSRPAARS